MRPAVVACLLLGFLDLAAAGSSAQRYHAQRQSPPAAAPAKAPARQVSPTLPRPPRHK